MIKDVIADLTLFPQCEPLALGLSEDKTITQELHIGDLHCNSLMLLWILVTSGIVKIDSEKYCDFVRLYTKINENNQLASTQSSGGLPGKPPIQKGDFEKIEPFTEEDSNSLLALFKSLTLANPNIILCFYGDEVTDRRASDALIIGLLAVLDELQVQFKILASNHLHFFVKNFLSTGDEDRGLLLFNLQGISLMHLVKSIDAGVLSKEKILAQVGRIYNKRLKLIDYTLFANTQKIAIRAHAPFDLQSILDAAKYFKLTVPDVFDNALEVAVFIDQINQKFKSAYVDVFFSGKSEVPEVAPDWFDYDHATTAVGALVWLKNFDKVNRPVPPQFNSMNCFLSHGHINAEKTPSMANRVSLNSESMQVSDDCMFPVMVFDVTPQLKSVVQKKLGFFGSKFDLPQEQPNGSGRASPVSPVNFQ